MKRPYGNLDRVVVVACAALGPALAFAGDQPASTLSGVMPSLTFHADPAQAPSPESQTARAWRADLTAWVWLVGMSGTVGIGANQADVNASFGDVVDASDSILAFSGRLELGYGEFGGFVDGMYADIGVDDQHGPQGAGPFDVSNKLGVVDFGLMYRLLDRKASGDAANNSANMSLDLYAGGRWASVSLEIDPVGQPAESRSKSWIDPIIGAKFVLPLSEHWHTKLNGDVGGFGASSDFTWSATAVLGYDFSLFDHPASVLAGYRAIGWDYTNSSGANEFKWDMVLHGPLLGFEMRF